MKEIWICAGEASGDLHGSALAAQLHQLQPEYRLRGVGGPLMARAGVDLIYDPTTLSTVGFWESLRVTPVLYRLLQRCGKRLAESAPELLVLIDFPGFNLPLAEMAHSRHIPVVYYLPPTAWLWGEGRAHRVAKACDRVLCGLAVEEQAYQKAGAHTCWVGHPLVDRVQDAPVPAQARAQLQLPADAPVFALLPGSRRQEIEQLLPVQLEAVRWVADRLPDARFLLPLAVTVPREWVEPWLHSMSVTVQVVPGPEAVYPALRAADAAVIASGTATLEAALLGTPAVIVYKTSRSTYWIGRRLLHLQQVGLPNLLAGRPILPELLQDQASGERIARWLIRFWSDELLRRTTQEALAHVKAALGPPGAVLRAAQEIQRLLVGSGEQEKA